MMDRRTFTALAAAAAALPGGARAQTGDTPIEFGPAEPFSHELLIEEARRRGAARYQSRPTVPAAWTDINYDQYRTYWFRSSDALWSDTDTPLRVDFLHPGLYYEYGVRIDVAEGGEAREVLFDMDLFDRTDQAPEFPMDDTVGFSGMRLRAPLVTPDIYTEFMVFQGASYFRAIARDLIYGLSARGLAIGTGSPEGEEFPDFVRMILERPEPGARTYVVHALLDSPSVAGAYRFEITTGDSTEVEVSATLFPRRALSNVGIAPLTSMFLFDQTNRNRFDDYRPAVHDSGGLAILNGAGEQIWRPLANPTTLQISAFQDQGPRGFGLLQRGRAFEDFADLEALYHRRPGLWIEPREDWGPGSITLVEIPIDKEFYDNIVAYWRPRADLVPGQAARFGYRMIWAGRPAPLGPIARVERTRLGAGPNGGQVVTIDYDSPIEGDGEITPVVKLSAGEITAQKLQVNPDTGNQRLVFTFEPGDTRMIEMRAQIERAGARASEVWLYRWTVQHP